MDKPRLGRRPKKPKLDHKSLAKIGSTIYHLDEVKGISIRVGLKNGTMIAFERSEDEDNFRRKGELKKIRTKFNKFTIEISPKDSAKNAYIKCDIKKLGEEFYYIDLTNMDKKDRKKIYSEESGFNLDQDESAEFL